MTETERREPRYFWTGWFDGQSFGLLAAVFAIFSLVDLLATVRTMMAGVVKEGNALANSVLTSHSYAGLIIYKVLLVLLVIGAVWMVDRSNPRLARGVLWGGILLMAVITVRHLGILTYMVVAAG